MATANIFTDGDFVTATPTGRARILRPFAAEGDNETRVVEVDYVQQALYFEPSFLNYTLYLHDLPEYRERGNFPNAYLVDESAQNPIGSTLVQFTRTFAEIPKRRVQFESYAWRRPGAEGGSFGARKTISGTPVQIGSTTRITTTTTHGLIVGDAVLIQLYATSSDGRSVTLSLKSFVTVENSTTVFTIPVFVDSEDWPNQTWQYVTEIGMQREAETVEVSSFVELDYWLPGVTANCATFADIPIIPRDVIIDSSGGEVDTLSDTTTPTQGEYLVNVASKKTRVVVASIIRRWKGNIYERATRYVYTE